MTPPTTMRALRLGLAPHRVALAMAAGRWREGLYHGAAGSPLQLTEVASPARPAGWVRVEPTLAGICGSDRALLHLHTAARTRVLMAFYGMPRAIIPGHEVVGVVTEADAGTGVSEGDRVVLEPTLTCVDKGFEPCGRCAHGDEHVCAHFADAGELPDPGNGFGLNLHGRFGGGWAEQLVAPAHRAYRVPDGMDDRTAVLAEPFAVAAHAVARNPPRPGDHVLVIGPGPIGLAIVHTLARLAPHAHVTVAAVDDFADGLARGAGAHALVHGTRARLIERIAGVLDATVRGNRLSGPVLESGFDVVFDTVGSPQTLDDAFRTSSPGGRVVLVALSTTQEVDWSLVFARELRVVGSAGTGYYADERVPEGARVAGGTRRAMRVALDVLADTGPAQLVTHLFPLEEPVDALDTAFAGPAARALKVTFTPQARV